VNDFWTAERSVTVDPPADAYNAVRRRVLPRVHDSLDVLIGGYALSDTPPEEYVATVECDEDGVERMLDGAGFSRNLIASLKVRADGNVSDGSWVRRDSLLSDHQLHVVLHESDTGTELYAHWEYSWIRHPYRHYLARDYSAATGVRKMRSLLEEHRRENDIEWATEPIYARHNWYLDLIGGLSRRLAYRLTKVPKRYRGGLTPETPGLFQRIASRLR